MSELDGMTVLLPAICVPKQIGIAQKEDTIWAISGCCGSDLNFNSKFETWYCSYCWITTIGRSDAPGSSVMQLSEGFTRFGDVLSFVSGWTGLEVWEFELKLEWDKETV